jgi:putative transferase (TIGR04331 family)
MKNKIIIKAHPRKDTLNKKNFKFWKEYNEKNKNIFKLNYDGTPDLIKKYTRYAIHTYEGTAFLEDLNLNNPFYLILKNDINFIRNSSKKYFRLLLDNKIAFERSIDAAKFIKKNDIHLEDWWYSKKIQLILKEVRFSLCRYDSDPVKKLRSFFTTI